jgi:hypothetical protein
MQRNHHILMENLPQSLPKLGRRSFNVGPQHSNIFKFQPHLMVSLDQNIRLQNEELGTFADDESLVKLSDGSGYFATLAVFHGLHCVKRLHHFVHRDNYYAEMSQSEADELLYHTGEPQSDVACVFIWILTPKQNTV